MQDYDEIRRSFLAGEIQKHIAKCIYDRLVEETGFTGGESYRN